MKFKNIALIGLPGCGKTTIGKLLEKKLQWACFDVDEYIEKKENRSIRDIFKEGENYFRKIESESLKEIIKESSPKIIATGGGVVKLYENMELLKENSIIIFINRSIEKIMTQIDVTTRPLLSEDQSKIYELYRERYLLYKKYCHYEVYNNKSIEEALDQILYILR